jgi:hypothetical protein
MARHVVKRPRMRPRFEISLASQEGDELLAELERRLKAGTLGDVVGRVLPKHAELTSAERMRHVWSPRLTLHVESEEDGAVWLSGRFSPHPSVWTGFLTLYSTLFLLGTFALIFGFSQWSLGMAPWALLGVPAAVALAGFTYGAAFIGQGLGSEEMYLLRSFLDEALRAVRGQDAQEPASSLPAA